MLLSIFRKVSMFGWNFAQQANEVYPIKQEESSRVSPEKTLLNHHGKTIDWV